VGYYTLEYTIPNTFILNEMYYVRWRGTDPNCLSSRDVSEEQFIVVDNTNSGSGAGCCLVPRFSNC
jgi:methyl coenzyme M reductase gamma subunit